MAGKRQDGGRNGAAAQKQPEATKPTPGSLAALAGLGVLASLWSLFLWSELVVSRSGRPAFCPLAEAESCEALWDSAFAAAIHRLSGLPVAGWGLAWGLVGFALPLMALKAVAEGRAARALVSAVRATAAAGLLAVLVMVGVSAAERVFCAGCFATHLLVAGYAGIALFGWRSHGMPEAGRGLATAASATLLAYVTLLYPGSRTPLGAGQAAREAIGAPGGAAPAGAPADPRRDEELRRLLASLDPGLRQAVSDSLFIHRKAAAGSLPAPRRLIGPETAPVRITEFTDALCSHCAELHRTLKRISDYSPPGSFSVEPRQFPLDAECNPRVQRRGEPLRCLAAKVQICLEGHEKTLEFQAALFEGQKDLTPDRLYALAAPYMQRPALEQCITSAQTRAKLEDDIALAERYDIDATPLVLINGRKATSVAPFLYAMILAGGDASHPAFQALPPPDPKAHIH
jgi:serine/threonine-protein kinase